MTLSMLFNDSASANLYKREIEEKLKTSGFEYNFEEYAYTYRDQYIQVIITIGNVSISANTTFLLKDLPDLKVIYMYWDYKSVKHLMEDLRSDMNNSISIVKKTKEKIKEKIK